MIIPLISTEKNETKDFEINYELINKKSLFPIKLIFYKDNLKSAANPKICMIQP